jgi:hypothetical protein
MLTTNNDTYAIWVPSNTGRQLLAFNTYDLAALYNIRFGGGLEIITYNIKH